MACSFSINDFIEHPVHASLFVIDFLLLVLVHTHMPFLMSLILVGGLVYLSMFFAPLCACWFSQAGQVRTSS